MSIILDKQHPTPVYLQLKEMLQSQIEQGIYSSHQRLPSERHLCQQYNLSRMTARRALQALIADGLAYTQAGKGTFVSRNSTAKIKTLINKEASAPYTVDHNNNGKLVQHRLELTQHLALFNSIVAEKLIQEALATYPLETVIIELLLGSIRHSEEQWLQGKIGLLAQNYAITTIRSQLTALVNTSTNPETGHKILLACAPEDQHELGLLSLAFGLRRRGFSVTYLGSMTISNDFYEAIEMIRPQLVCISAATTKAAKALNRLSQNFEPKFARATKAPHQKIFFTFAGVAFCHQPELIPAISGIYLGDTIEKAVDKILSILTP